MRDGIYKNLPMGSNWKSLLKSCERAKERGVTAHLKAKNAIARDIALEISAPFLGKLQAKVLREESMLPGMIGIQKDSNSRDFGGNNSPFENDILENAKRHEANGIRGKEILYKALKDSIEKQKERRFRQLEQHCLTNAGTKSKPIISAARAAVGQIDSESIANQIVNGEKPQKQSSRRPVDLDENLKEVS